MYAVRLKLCHEKTSANVVIQIIILLMTKVAWKYVENPEKKFIWKNFGGLVALAGPQHLVGRLSLKIFFKKFFKPSL